MFGEILSLALLGGAGYVGWRLAKGGSSFKLNPADEQFSVKLPRSSLSVICLDDVAEELGVVVTIRGNVATVTGSKDALYGVFERFKDRYDPQAGFLYDARDPEEREWMLDNARKAKKAVASMRKQLGWK